MIKISLCDVPMHRPMMIGWATGVAVCIALSGCATDRSRYAQEQYVPPRQSQPATPQRYLPPGPPEDPWGPYIRTASARFSVSEIWIRAIMQRESGGAQYRGDTPIISPAGAMGLMQIMPDTYENLRFRYGLGPDPYEPQDNILAGTVYIRDLYTLYGFPSFIAAYNAGEQYLNACLIKGTPLPQETVSYLLAVAPQLRAYAVTSGPLAGYATANREVSADTLNQQVLTQQFQPAAAAASAPVLPCMPPAEDRSADALNRATLLHAVRPIEH